MTTAAFASISPAGLTSRLRDATSGSLVVLTPNRRLAQSLEAAHDAARVAEGLASWPAADILPIDDWTRRLHEESAVDDAVPAPVLLAEEQEAFVWESVVAGDRAAAVLVGTAALAREARAAWSLANDWDLDGALGSWEASDDAQAFARWAAAWRKRLEREGWIDAAGLAGRAARLLAGKPAGLPQAVVAYAFDILTPAQRRLLQAARAAGIEVLACAAPEGEARPSRIALATPKEEIEFAARWARARLASAPATGAGRIGVVVPQLAERRGLVERVFERVLGDARLYEFSLGDIPETVPALRARYAQEAP